MIQPSHRFGLPLRRQICLNPVWLYPRFPGDLLIVMAQIIVAAQMVYEQKYVTKYDVPALLAVGCEGMWTVVE